MNRSRKILITCHCVLNANAKIFPLAEKPGVFTQEVMPFIESGCGIVQLPCPETCYLGMNRWGMTREQYDHPSYRKHCRDILEAPLAQLIAYKNAGYEFVGLMGMDGSPSCGINKTCEGYSGGEISTLENLEKQQDSLKEVQGKGVFMSELLQLLEQEGIQPKLLAIEETS